MRKIVGGTLLTVLLFTGIAHAYLPTSIEAVIKSWFSSAGKLVKMTFFPSTQGVSGNDRCDIYMDRATMNLMTSCDGATATVLATASALGCTQDTSGILTCNAFVSLDQNALTPVAGNRWRVFDNDVDLTPNPSCADYGQAGTFTFLDVDESVTDVFVTCNGTTEAMSLGSTIPNCTLAGAFHLTYDQATRAWGCD